MEDITEMPHLGLLLCHKNTRKERRDAFVQGSATSRSGSCQHSLQAGEGREQLGRAGLAVSSTQGARMQALREQSEVKEKSGVKKKWPREVGKQNSWDRRAPIKSRTRH